MTEKKLWLKSWCLSIKETIDNAVRECYPRFWKENDITTAILRALCTEYRRVILVSNPKHYMFSIEWDAFKLDGKIEEDCGDVAIVVRLHSDISKPLEGVGYFEAKRIYNSGRFDGIKKWEQLELMRHNVAHHHIVFYDYEGCSWNRHRPGMAAWDHSGPFNNYCLTMPTNKAIALHKKNRELYSHSISFWEQLCLRYLQGFDLEFEPYLVENAKGFIEKKGGPKFLLVADVSVSDGDISPPPIFKRIKVSESYIPIIKDFDAQHHDQEHE